jgi:hypothetical protein
MLHKLFYFIMTNNLKFYALEPWNPFGIVTIWDLGDKEKDAGVLTCCMISS